MRVRLVAVIALSAIMTPILSARSDEIPVLNVQPLCRGIVSQADAPLEAI
jgi:hypothetical protein